MKALFPKISFAACFIFLTLLSHAIPAGAENAGSIQSGPGTGWINYRLNANEGSRSEFINEDGTLNRNFSFALGLTETAEARVNAGMAAILLKAKRHEFELARIVEKTERGGEAIQIPADPAMYIAFTRELEAVLKETMTRPDTGVIAGILAANSGLGLLLSTTFLSKEKGSPGEETLTVESCYDPAGSNLKSISRRGGEYASRRWVHLLTAEDRIRARTSVVNPDTVPPGENPYAGVWLPKDLLWSVRSWPGGITGTMDPPQVVLQRINAIFDEVGDVKAFKSRFRGAVENCQKEALRLMEPQFSRKGNGSVSLDYTQTWEALRRCRKDLLEGLPEGGDKIWLQNCFAGLRECSVLEFRVMEAPDQSGRRILSVWDPASGKRVGLLWGDSRVAGPVEKRIFERLGISLHTPAGSGLDPFASGPVGKTIPGDSFAPMEPK